MSSFYRAFVRPLLFAQDSEIIHERTLNALACAGRQPFACQALEAFFSAPALPVAAFGLNFPNPVGLAAGMDKYAAALPVWPALGFGFTELGGVTWHPQPGNPSPRLFRAVSEDALINRMGFNNAGATAMARQLEAWRLAGLWPSHPVGVNLGKSKTTPLESAAEDYANSLRALWTYGDFFVVNVSSPNTPNLRQLQDKGPLDEILAALQQVNMQMGEAALEAGKDHTSVGTNIETASPTSGTHTVESAPERHANRPGGPKPILVKIAPDLTFAALDEMLEILGPRQVSGIVATNTTTCRPEPKDPSSTTIYSEPGGLSGRPLRARSTEVIRYLYQQTKGALPVIGVGGIFSAEDAWEKITAGACLVQTYTGLVYEGPSLVREIVAGLLDRMSAEGLTHIGQAVGIAAGGPRSG